MATDPLVDATATEQAQAVRNGDISARELCDAVLERIAAIDDRIGAFLHVDTDGARRAADAADARRRSGDELGPLHGVPFTVKDLFDTAGLPTTYGSLIHRDHVPARDAVAVERLRAAGAVLIGKVNTPEFGLAAETITRFGPRCNNPWDVTRTSGGSSGGSAAAVAASMGSISLASDAGGSIRLPAAWCGVIGLKPTYGRVPVGPARVAADHPLETAGPIARDVRDIALVLDIVAGADQRDPVAVPADPPRARAAVDEADRPLAVRYGIDLGLGTVDRAIADGIERSMRASAASGAVVEPSALAFGEPHPFFLMFDLVAGASAARLADARDRFDDLADYTQTFLATGRELSAADYSRAVYASKVLRAMVDRELEHCDVIALPTTATVAWRHGAPPAEVGGQPVASHGGIDYGGIPHLALANVTGHPAITVPCGLDGQGLPLAVQFIARHWDEAALMRAAARLLAAQPFTRSPDVTGAIANI